MNQEEIWTRVGSRMPPEDTYWDDLARRLGDDATDALESLRPRGSPWLSVTSKHARSLLVLAAAAVVAALTLLPQPATSAAPVGGGFLLQANDPRDPALIAVWDGVSPPRLETLLFEEGRLIHDDR